MQNILVEENGYYYIDCSKAIWSTDEINSVYKKAKLHLNDVDFVIETDDILILVEYKNANIKQAVNPSAFNPSDNKRVEKIWRKYYDSLHYLVLKNKTKTKHYVYILEYPNSDIVMRKRLRERIASDLPFLLSKNLMLQVPMISKFDILSIDEWNEHDLYSNFPIKKVTSS